jgi:hypothetical protein
VDDSTGMECDEDHWPDPVTAAVEGADCG